MKAGFSSAWERKVLELFLDWQFDEFVVKNIPLEFLEELRGLQNGAESEHKIHSMRSMIQRTLVISSYPGDFGNDIIYAMVDVFLQKYLRLHNQQLLNIV